MKAAHPAARVSFLILKQTSLINFSSSLIFFPFLLSFFFFCVHLRLTNRACAFLFLLIVMLIAKLGERPTIPDSHSDKVLKDFTDQKRDEKMYKKVPIFRCTTPSTGKRLGEVVVGTLV